MAIGKGQREAALALGLSAKRTMRLRFPGRVVFAIYSTSSVTRGFATVFSKFIDATKLKVIVSDDPTMIERQLR